MSAQKAMELAEQGHCKEAMEDTEASTLEFDGCRCEETRWAIGAAVAR